MSNIPTNIYIFRAMFWSNEKYEFIMSDGRRVQALPTVHVDMRSLISSIDDHPPKSESNLLLSSKNEHKEQCYKTNNTSTNEGQQIIYRKVRRDVETTVHNTRTSLDNMNTVKSSINKPSSPLNDNISMMESVVAEKKTTKETGIQAAHCSINESIVTSSELVKYTDRRQSEAKEKKDPD